MIPIRDNNPTKTFPAFTLLIIAANILIFLYQVSLGPEAGEFIASLATVPLHIINMGDALTQKGIPVPATLLTSLFLHGSFMHLGGNMLYLWIFGNNIEDRLGHSRFLIFYLLCGLIATSFHIASNPESTSPLIGASGAIAGILGAYLLLFPKARIDTLIFIVFFVRIIRVPAFFFLSFWFLLQALNAPYGGQVAWMAHIGGFLAGFILVKLFQKKW